MREEREAHQPPKAARGGSGADDPSTAAGGAGNAPDGEAGAVPATAASATAARSGRQETVTYGTDESSLRTQATRFFISGVASAVVDYTFTALTQFFFGYGTGTSRTVGFIFGTLTAYMINRRWTFRAEPSVRRFVAVCLLYSVTYCINVGGYKYGFLLLDGWGWPDLLASVVAFVVSQGTATVANFIIQRTVIFRGVR